jgi:hypothetical protein
MSFQLYPVETQSTFAPEPAAHCVELAKYKTETSATLAARKRRSHGQRKLSRLTKEQHRAAKRAGLYAVAVTLTYRDNDEFSSRHISEFLARLRQFLKRKGHNLPYAWVLERAGQLHYHMILWLPRGVRIDDARLCKWWPWGSTWREGCRSVRDWSKYMSKFDGFAKLPKGARLLGYGGLDEEGQAAVARAALPRWLQKLLPHGHRARRFPGAGWVDLETGELHHSPYAWTPWGVTLTTANPRTVRKRLEGVAADNLLDNRSLVTAAVIYS